MRTADFEWAGDKRTFGNPEGTSLLSKVVHMEDDLARLNGQVEKHHQKLQDHEDTILQQRDEIHFLQNQVHTLSLSSEGHRKIRNRFLECYKRDFLGSENRSSIQAGNIVAHEPDCRTDASLFFAGKESRSDSEVFFDIYGTWPDFVQKHVSKHDSQTIQIINRYASLRIKSAMRDKIPADVSKAFFWFLRLRASRNADLSNYSSDVGRAFLEASNAIRTIEVAAMSQSVFYFESANSSGTFRSEADEV